MQQTTVDLLFFRSTPELGHPKGADCDAFNVVVMSENALKMPYRPFCHGGDGSWEGEKLVADATNEG